MYINDLNNLQHRRTRQRFGANAHVCAQPEPLLPLRFTSIKTKQDDGDVFWSIFGHVSLLKVEKYVEDDNRESVLHIDIVSSRKYRDYTSIVSGEYSPNTYMFIIANAISTSKG